MVNITFFIAATWAPKFSPAMVNFVFWDWEPPLFSFFFSPLFRRRFDFLALLAAPRTWSARVAATAWLLDDLLEGGEQ